jgi:F-type H+-transporting ATPase subunit delta
MAESDDITAQDAATAAQIQADVGVEHLADVYAQGLLGAAENAGQSEQLLAEFRSLLTDVLDPFPKLEAILASAFISHEDKVGMLDRMLAGRYSPLLISFLKIVSRHGRLDCLRVIHRQTALAYDRLRGRVHVELTTATPLDEAAAGRIAENLRAVLGGEPVLRRTTNPDLIGGAVLRVGDTVYDSSIANQLHLFRQQMIQRSAHEIQSRRDRFRDPARDRTLRVPDRRPPDR